MVSRRLIQGGKVVAIVLNGVRCSHEFMLVCIVTLYCFRSEEQSAVAAVIACFF